MKQKHFVNRYKELTFFKADMKFLRENPKVVFLQGKSGVGKSALARVIIGNTEQPSVRVEVPSRGKNRTEAGLYIRKLAEALHGTAPVQKFESIYDFGKIQAKKSLGSGIWRNILLEAEHLKVPVAMSARKIIDKRGTSGSFSPKVVFQSEQTEAQLFIREYIHFLVTSHNLIINVENVQAIDPESLDFFYSLVDCNNKSYFIFECTSDGRQSVPMREMVGEFSHKGCDVEVRCLEALPFSDYLEVARKLNLNQNDLLKNAYVRTGGDLRALVDLTVYYSAKADIPDFNIAFNSHEPNDTVKKEISKSNLLSLSPFDQFILCSIAVHDASVTTSYLRQAYKTDLFAFEVEDVETSLFRLEQKHNLIDVDNGRATIQHDRIIELILTDVAFTKYRVMAGKMWVTHYEELLEGAGTHILSRSDLLAHLLRLYASFQEVEKLFSRLQEIHEVALSSLYPGTALDYLKAIQSGLAAKQSHNHPDATLLIEVKFALLDTYYGVGLFEEAQDLLRSISVSSQKRNVYEALLLDRLDKHGEAIKFCKDKLSSLPDNLHPSYIYSLKLILMTSYRSLWKIKECKKTYENMSRDRQITSFPEYGYLLRNSEIVLPPDKGINELNASVRFFEEKEDLVRAAHSQISLSMQLARIGNLEQAEQILLQAEERLVNKTMERHILKNNLATIKMMNGEIDNSTEAKLHQARETVTTSFDKIAIWGNLLIYYSLAGDPIKAEKAVELLNQSLQTSGQPDKLIHLAVNYNIGKHYERQRKDHLRDHYWSMAKSVDIDKDSYWSVRLWGGKEVESHYKFRIRFPFHFHFISYWHFGVNPELPHC